MFLESSLSQSTFPAWGNLCCRESWVQVCSCVTISHSRYRIFPPLNVKCPATLTVMCKSFLLKTVDTCYLFRKSLYCCCTFWFTALWRNTHKVTQKPSPKTSTDPWKKRALQTLCCTKTAVSHACGSYWRAPREGKSWQTPAGSWGWGSRPVAGHWLQGQRTQVPRGSTSRTLLLALLLKLDQQVNLACQLQRQGLRQDINFCYIYTGMHPRHSKHLKSPLAWH